MQTKVSSEGQVVLPASVRRKLGLRPGDPLDVKTANGSVILTPRKSVVRRLLYQLIPELAFQCWRQKLALRRLRVSKFEKYLPTSREASFGRERAFEPPPSPRHRLFPITSATCNCPPAYYTWWDGHKGPIWRFCTGSSSPAPSTFARPCGSSWRFLQFLGSDSQPRPARFQFRTSGLGTPLSNRQTKPRKFTANSLETKHHVPF
jgi:AbrB family looped-hinge helix DNA binding protein